MYQKCYIEYIIVVWNNYSNKFYKYTHINRIYIQYYYFYYIYIYIYIYTYIKIYK